MRQFEKESRHFCVKNNISFTAARSQFFTQKRKHSVYKKRRSAGQHFLNKILAIKDNGRKGRTIYDRVMKIRVKNMLMLD